ncbi:MAG: M20/M25/M40 family metallo-hydrolase [Puniceicoccales bacterium]|jgi:acetylornithine deacetylase/succinyl-diaminopimelate desuccinylase-like protein|nr:M20/M25/M40 family metallo-hydrolase [Puniceicoccales bacterium]
MDAVQVISDYVRFPSVSTDPAFRGGMTDAKNFAARLLHHAGLAVEEVGTDLHDIVIGRRDGPDSWPHIVLYGHYDVQPADPLDLWTSPPFSPTVRDKRLFARGAADNKGPHSVAILALASLLARQPDLPLRITAIIEGEEEIGSPSFPKFLQQRKEELSKADFVLLSDTGSPSSEQIVVTTGLRGIVGIEVRLTGPKTDLHSGLHGGAVVNPIYALAQLCASLHNPDGSVNIPGFYDGVATPTQWEINELTKFPLTEPSYREFLGVDALYSQPHWTPIEATRHAPTLEFNGIGGGYQGEGGKTVIPSTAFVKITCRLVPGQDARDIINKLSSALKSRTPRGVHLELIERQGNNAYRVCPPNKPDTPRDQNPVLARAFHAASEAIADAFGNPPLFLSEGGSVPIIGDFKTVAGLDSLMIGLFTPDSNLHAPNENLELSIIERGISAYQTLLKKIASQPRS